MSDPPALFTDEDFNFLTLYWLSGWFGDNYEIWKGKKSLAASDPLQAVFPVTLVWPLTEEPEDSVVIIRKQDTGLVMTVDWFPGEEFSLDLYRSEDKPQIILMATFERETAFLHLK